MIFKQIGGLRATWGVHVSMWQRAVQDVMESDPIELKSKIEIAEFAIFTRISSSLPDEHEQQELFEALSKIQKLRVTRIGITTDVAHECVSLPRRSE
jgi:hypothetical protein